MKLDLTGERFGRLVVVEEGDGEWSEAVQKILTTWICLCDCDNEIEVQTRYLRAGSVKSCGCLLSQRREEVTVDV